MDFILSAISEHKSSGIYRTAADAEAYYSGENPTISRYEKILYDMQGRAYQDMYTANHKIASSFFRLAVDQENSYLLGNGVTFRQEATKKRLGADFDQQVQDAGEYALIGGVSFGFWNVDHVEIFRVQEFKPLYDEENASLCAGIRFWQIDEGKPLRATLYELDGYTEYIRRCGEDMQILKHKRAYRLKITGDRKDHLDGTQILEGENYPTFPIVPLRNNRSCQSELCGKRNTIDALDLVSSNMVNNVDEGNLIYWVLTNCSGMDDLDDQKFLERLKITRVAHAEGGDGASVEAHTIEAPYAGTEAAAEMLEKRLHKDFQTFNSTDVTASNQSATAIDAAYTNLDLKADKFERQVTKFIQGILKLAGIDDTPTYTRSRIINKQEEIQSLLLLAPYVDDDYITQKGLTILGDGDMAEEILKRRAAEDLQRYDEVVGDDTDLTDAAGTAGKTLNASQTSSLIATIKGVKSGEITEEQAVRILVMSTGATREEALDIILGKEYP